MMRSTWLAFGAVLLLAGSVAGCDCNGASKRVGDGGVGDGGKRLDGGLGLDGQVAEPDDAGEEGGPDAAPKVGIGPGHFKDPGNSLDGLSQTDAGYLTLDRTQVQLHFAWLANPNGFGTVSKIDTTSGKEVARYYAVIPVKYEGGALVPNGLTYNMGHSSSRTAVDLNGDVWLANRAFGMVGSVTKIANARADCLDRNGNGKIDTSEDKNANGVIDAEEIITPADPNDPKQYDECVRFTTPIGTQDQPVVPRALAIAAGIEGSPGEVWVGLWCGMSGPDYDSRGYATCNSEFDGEGGAFVKLSPTTGEILNFATGKNYVKVPIKPYGAAIDAQNRVWMSHYPHTWTAAVLADGTATPAYKAPQDWGGYGITVQVTKDGKTRIWIANIGANAAVSRYNVDTNDWTQWDFAAQIPGEPYGQGRGIAVDDKGIVWMSSHRDDVTPGAQCSGDNPVVRLVGIDSETGLVQKFNGKGVIDISKHYTDKGEAPPCTGLGVGMDSANHVWVASANGYATGVDRSTGEVKMRSPGLGALYTYSDFTGYTLRTFTAPQGSFKTVFTGCPEGAITKWQTLTWDGVVPATTKLRFWVRSAAERRDFSIPGTRFGPFETSPASLAAAKVPDNPYLQVEVEFISLDKVSSPMLKRLEATFACDVQVN